MLYSGRQPNYAALLQDVSFWTSDGFTENDLCEVVRGIAGKLPHCKILETLKAVRTIRKAGQKTRLCGTTVQNPVRCPQM